MNPTMPKGPTATQDPMVAHARWSPAQNAPHLDRPMSHGVPSALVLGVLPVARVIPMDCHSLMDYGAGIAIGAMAITTDCPKARTASAALAGSLVLVSSMTDYRLSVAKVIPIETHEKLDHLWGVAAIASPFVFGYWKSAPRVAMAHVIAGATTIVTSLFTDYRAYRGKGRSAPEPAL